MELGDIVWHNLVCVLPTSHLQKLVLGQLIHLCRFKRSPVNRIG
jgi:hypothetical protein